MDKFATKRQLSAAALPTPTYRLLSRGERLDMSPPLVIKALCEGSSFDMAICHDQAAADAALGDLFERHGQLLIERFIAGREITVAIVGEEAMPPIHIVPATTFYDYQAKYTRDDTQYRFDIDLPPALLNEIQRLALQAHQLTDCRHLSRVDFIVDDDARPWILEINTLPGFTTHSLVPMAARHAGIDMPTLVARLVVAARSDRLA
jgi:D-alanine-D-alanine ligase